LAAGLADLVAFGRPFIANPDLVERLRNDWPPADGDNDTFYGGGAAGYTDYPAYRLEAEPARNPGAGPRSKFRAALVPAARGFADGRSWAAKPGTTRTHAPGAIVDVIREPVSIRPEPVDDRTRHPAARPRPRQLRGRPRAALRQAPHGRPLHLLRPHGPEGPRAGPAARGGRATAPAHRPFDHHLPVRRRDHAPRQRRLRAGHPPGRGQLDDRRPRHHPLRTLRAPAPRRRADRRHPGLGGAARCAGGNGSGLLALPQRRAAGVRRRWHRRAPDRGPAGGRAVAGAGRFAAVLRALAAARGVAGIAA